MIEVAAAIVVAWLAGTAVVVWSWPAREPLSLVGGIGLAALFGPLATGTALAVAGMCGVAPAVSWPLIAAAAVVAGPVAAWRARRTVRVDDTGAWLGWLLAIVIAGTTALSLKTHLGWDGTVVWYHKARIIATSGGHMPAAAVADRTRAWTAPDYPLHVPLAMAWVRVGQREEDERAFKLLPAAWAAAALCLIVAMVLERSEGAPDGRLRAGAALLVLATTPRLLVGEGSLTSGYADGPLAAAIAALSWIAVRADWAADRRWHRLLALLAIQLVWTKQEGVVAVLAVAVACLWRQRHWRAAAFAGPALVVAAAWFVATVRLDAPVAMAYAWPGAGAAAARLPLVARAYLREVTDVGVWGAFWPGLTGLLLAARAPGSGVPLAVLGGILAIGAMAFLASGWPDVTEHLAVTVPRQLIQIAPALVGLAFTSSRRASKSNQNATS